MNSHEDGPISVWRQSLVDESASAKIDEETYSVRSIARRGVRQVIFLFNGKN